MIWNEYFESTFATTIRHPEVWESVISKELPEATNEALCDAVKYLDRTWDHRRARPPGVRAFIGAYQTQRWERNNKVRSSMPYDDSVTVTPEVLAENRKVWEAAYKACCEALRMEYGGEGDVQDDIWQEMTKDERLEHLIAEGRRREKVEVERAANIESMNQGGNHGSEAKEASEEEGHE